MRTVASLILAVTAAFALAASPAQAARPVILPGGNVVGGALLEQYWTRILSLPVASNPVAGAGDPCAHIAGGAVLAPIVAPGSAAGFTCTARLGMPVFLVGFSAACDELEPPFPVGAQAQRACAREFDASANVHSTRFSIDGAPPVELHARAFETVSPQRTVQLPPDNLIGVPPGPDPFVAHGWVGLAVLLAAGRHVIRQDVVSDLLTATSSYTVAVGH